MTTSNDTSFTITRDQIITAALKMLGVIGAGQTPSANDISDCALLLNIMILDWQGQGIHLWKETEGTIPVVANQYIYTLNSSNYPSIGRPLNIMNCRYAYSSGLERKLKKMGRSEYMSLPTKSTSTGPSTAFYFSPQLQSMLLYVWPVPQDSTDSFSISYTSSIQDFDNSTDTPDFTQEWSNCLILNLAVLASPQYGIDLTKVNPSLIKMAERSLMTMEGWDSEEGSINIIPNYRWDD